MQPRHVVALCVVAWVALWIHPAVVLPLGYFAYVGMAAAVAWSALRHRQRGWGWGVILAVLLMTLPLWVVGGYLMYAWVVG